MAAHTVSADDVERTITAFARLDQRGDKKAMNKLAQRLQREQPFLLQHAAAVKNEHGDTVGEAAVFYATLIWAMFDRGRDGTLPRLTAQNLADADKVVTDALSAIEGIADRPAHERLAPALVSPAERLRQAGGAAGRGRQGVGDDAGNGGDDHQADRGRDRGVRCGAVGAPTRR